MTRLYIKHKDWTESNKQKSLKLKEYYSIHPRTEAARKNISETLKTKYKDLEFKKMMYLSQNTQEAKEKAKKSKEEYFNTPGIKDMISQKSKKSHNTPEFKEKVSRNSSEMWKNLDTREKSSQTHKIVMNMPEVKEKISDKLRAFINSPDIKIKYLLNLKKIMKKNTKPEVIIHNVLDMLGIAYEKQYLIEDVTLADIFIEPNIIIQCDGDYWHGFKYSNLNNEEIEKIQPIGKQQKCILNGVLRDRKSTNKLLELGYIVFRFWEHDIKNKNPQILEKLLSLDICKNFKGEK